MERGDGERQFEADRQIPGTERQTGREGQDPWIGTGWGGGRIPLGGHRMSKIREGQEEQKGK